MPARALPLLFLMCLIRFSALAQTIRGEVLDMATKKAIADVSIENIHTSLNISTGTDGAFNIAASSGQLLEFKKPGYKTARVRIPQGYIPSYFRIILQKGVTNLQDKYLAGNRYDPKMDSIRYRELYKHELDVPKMSAIDMISHPFSAMSGKNREIWQFQDDYNDFEKEKYVDRTFTPAVVTKFTGLTGDSLNYYMRRYRPSYEQLRGMNDYAFFNFIKGTVHRYRNYAAPGNAQ